MDQMKIGKFIASCRKEQGMTQAVLAEKLGISDRAISKWETGKSMPDSGIMLDLCELLKINVNELLSGERIMAEAYDKRAEGIPDIIPGSYRRTLHVLCGCLRGVACMGTGHADCGCCCDDFDSCVYRGRD